MNERIRELAEQQGLTGPNFLISSHELEKFAELIVRECAGLARTKSDFIAERVMKFAEDTDEEISGKAAAWQFLVFEQEIKKHFGVEQ